MAARRSQTIFMTGFPGFIGRKLIKRILEKSSHAQFLLLVQERLAERALAERNELLRTFALPPDRLRILKGDITKENLGLDAQRLDEVLAATEVLYHLAALYDLATPRKPAHLVNVQGTVNVLDLCERMKRLTRLVYFSTCYVSGDREGVVLEDELDKGQGFRNYYEETKYLAEAEVAKRLDRIPTVIVRPAIVVGDSRTGETAKYDGPYFIIRFYMQKPKWLPAILIGEMQCPTNLVPVDYVVEATITLAGMEEAAGKTFHIADPRPLSVRDFSDRICDALKIPHATNSLPEGVARVLGYLKPVQNWTGIPRQLIPFLNHHAIYDTAHARELLEPAGVFCPSMPDYFETLFRYVEEHPDL